MSVMALEGIKLLTTEVLLSPPTSYYLYEPRRIPLVRHNHLILNIHSAVCILSLRLFQTLMFPLELMHNIVVRRLEEGPLPYCKTRAELEGDN
jgi:hypothetical protein